MHIYIYICESNPDDSFILPLTQVLGLSWGSYAISRQYPGISVASANSTVAIRQLSNEILRAGVVTAVG